MEKLLEKFPDIKDALNQPNGARFYKCALQINFFNYGSSFQGKKTIDEANFNQSLADHCNQNNIEVVGIADHGNVEHIEKLRNTLQIKGITVFPGFEIASTEKIHIVCLYDPHTTRDQLNRYLGDLQLMDPDQAVAPSRLGCLDIAKKVLEHGGIWYAAHMTGNNGLLKLDGPGNNYQHIWIDQKNVLAGQIPGPISDLPENYKEIVLNKNVSYRRNRSIAVINAKDVVEPEDLNNPSTSCYIKMTSPTIEALKQAFYDPESRIRLNSEVEQKPQSCVVAAAWASGFLDGVRIHLSENLNSVIGGRGAGKSTILETIRYCLDLNPKGKEAITNHGKIVQNALGNGGRIQILIKSQKQMGKYFVISRRYGEAPSVFSDDGRQSNLTPNDLLPGLEVYGQNEILEISRQENDILTLIKKFLPESHEDLRKIKELDKALEANRIRLLAAKKEWDEIASQLGQLSKLKEQEVNFKSLGLGSKIENVRKLARGDQVLKRAREEINALKSKLNDLNDTLPQDLAYLSGESIKEIPHSETLTSLRTAFEHFKEKAAPSISILQKEIEKLQKGLEKVENAWKIEKNQTELEVENLLKTLPDFAGKPGSEIGKQFVQIQKRIESILPFEKREWHYKKLIDELENQRKELLHEWSDVHLNQYQELEKIVKRINSESLKGKLRIDLKATGNREKLKSFLIGKVEGVGGKKVEWVDVPDQFLISTLVTSLKKGEEALLEEYRQYGMSPGMAKQLANLDFEKICLLEEVQLEDSVEIRLNVAPEGREEFKPLKDLSTGQKCTAILHLLMLENEEPLLVDQPEDNLDNAFIADRIVTEMREQKCRRQFLFATHNPNIPVFGDAEWIGALESNQNQAFLNEERVGSIDKQSVQLAVEQILEGGRHAFETRRMKYGF